MKPSTSLLQVEVYLILKGRHIYFVNNVKYFGVIFIKKLHRDYLHKPIASKALRAFISIYILLKSERLSVNAKLTFYKTLIRSIISYACPA
jgi:hypothetical protein